MKTLLLFLLATSAIGDESAQLIRDKLQVMLYENRHDLEKTKAVLRAGAEIDSPFLRELPYVIYDTGWNWLKAAEYIRLIPENKMPEFLESVSTRFARSPGKAIRILRHLDLDHATDLKSIFLEHQTEFFHERFCHLDPSREMSSVSSWRQVRVHRCLKPATLSSLQR